MYRLILISTLISIAHSSVIHNHDEGHSSLYTQLQSQQQEPQHLLTALKLQYVAPKAFLTSAGLVTGQQITPTQNPQLISPTIQSIPIGNPRHLSNNPSQIITSPNSEIVARNSQQLVNSNLQQIPVQQLVTSNVEFVTQPRNNQNVPTTSQPFLSVLNSQYLTNTNSEQSATVTGRNQQYLSTPQFITSTNVEQVTGNQQYLSPVNSQLTPTANPQLSNQQYITATNAPIITPRNPQIYTTVSPVISTDNSQLIQSIPQQNTVTNPGIPLVYTIQSPVESYSGQRYNRLPATNSIIPELQFADPRSNVIIPNAQIASLLNALYQPSYLLMMPPTSYTAVNYYDDPENNPVQDTNSIQSDSIQTEDIEDHINNSKSNLVQRSNSDATIEAESEKQTKEVENDDAFKLSYKDNHVKYSY